MSTMNLVEAPLRRQQRESFADAVRAYSGALFRYCWGRLGDRHLAEDAVQETFLRAYGAMGNESIAHLPGWLFGTARRCCQEVRRRRNRPADRAVPLEAVADPPAPGSRESLEVLLEALSDEERSLVYLKHVSGLRCRQIAEAMSVPVGTVTSSLARSYAKMRAAFLEQE